MLVFAYCGSSHNEVHLPSWNKDSHIIVFSKNMHKNIIKKFTLGAETVHFLNRR